MANSEAEPARVTLFSDRMIEALGQKTPPEKALAACTIAGAPEQFGRVAGDLAIRGGDLHFAKAAPHVVPDELGPPFAREEPYERNNRWLIVAASRYCADRMDLIRLWIRERRDGPCDAQYMMEAVRSKGGRAIWLNTRELGS